MRPGDADQVEQRLRELSTTLGSELVVEILAMFRQDGSAQFTDLQNACQRRELKAMQSAAHRLLGSVLLIGARHLAQLCRKLELLARQGDEVSAFAAVAELEQEFTILLAWVCQIEL
jgi:HPt (histidine-containing phosphotransfer) domain-containing protein